MHRAALVSIGLLTTFLTGCAHPYLKSGANLAAAIQKGDAAVTTLMDAEARTERVYRYVQPAAKVFGINQPDDIDSAFVSLVCRPHARALLAERVALNNLEQFRASLEANATDPKDASLAAMIASMSADAATFKPQDPQKAIEELQAKRDQNSAACSKSTRELFVKSPPAGALTVAVALAAWPKVRDFLSLLATEANKRKREQAILSMLKDTDIQKSLQQSLDVLIQSTTSGRMNGLAVSQQQIALWSAYAQYKTILALTPPQDVAKFRELYDAAVEMGASMKAYDDISAVDLPAVVKGMQDALTKLQQAAATGKSPDGSTLAELFAFLDFLSAASEKYAAAADAF